MATQVMNWYLPVSKTLRFIHNLIYFFDMTCSTCYFEGEKCTNKHLQERQTICLTYPINK